MKITDKEATEFWCVFCPSGGAPTARHFSEQAATLEAERLAKQNPARTFYVLHAVASRRVDSMQRMDLRKAPDDDGLPF